MGTFVVKVDGWTEREIESRALRLATLVRRAWRAVSRDLYATLSTKKTITERDLELLPKSWQQHADELVLGYITDTFVDSAGHIAAALDAPDGELIGDDIVDTFVNVARKRVRSMSDDVWDAVRAQLAEGIQKGESVAEIAARVRDTTGVTTPKALTIARTEVHAAHEAGSFEQALYVDPHARKEWLATKDERTRPSHREAAGQSRRIGDTFMVGGTTLRFPGDPLGEAGEVINCRCTSTYIFDMIDSMSDASTSDDALIAAFDPKSHPRGKDGRFIKKGSALFDLLTAKSDEDFLKALDNISVSEWKNMTQKQLEQVNGRIRKTQADAHDKMVEGEAKKASSAVPKKIKSSAGVKLSPAVAGSEPGSAMKMSTTVIWAANPHNAVIAESKTGDERVIWDGNAKKYKLQTGHPPTGEWTDVESFSKKGAYEKFKGDNKWVVPNPDNHIDLAALDNESDVPSIPQQVKPATLDTPNIAPVDVAPVPDVGSKPDVAPSQATTGTPVKVTTGVIWGKYEAGTPILESSDGKSQVVWNGKKYEVQSRLDDGTWQTKSEMTKKDAYAKLKGDTSWVTPSPHDSSEPVAGITPSAPDVPVDTTPNVPEPSIQKTNIADIGVDTKPNAPRVMDGSDIKPSDVLFDIDEATASMSNGSTPGGVVLAVNADGTAKLVTAPGDGGGVELQTLDSYGDWKKSLYLSDDALQKIADKNPQVAYGWFKPASSDETLSNNSITDGIAFPSSVALVTGDDNVDVNTLTKLHDSGQFKNGDVLALSPSGVTRLIVTPNGVEIQQQQKTGEWIHWKSANSITDLINDGLYLDGWYKPKLKPVDPEVAALQKKQFNVSDPSVIASKKLIDVDDLRTRFNSLPAGMVMGISKGGDDKLIKTINGVQVQNTHWKNGTQISQEFNGPTAFDDIVKANPLFAWQWMYPTSKTSTNTHIGARNVDIQPSNVKFDVDEALFDYYGGDMPTGDVVAVSPSGDAFLEVIPDGFALMTLNDNGSSSPHKMYTGHNQLESVIAEYPEIGKKWVKPKSKISIDAQNTDISTPKSFVQSTPQSNHVTHSTDLLTQDKTTSNIPHNVKVSLKNKMKSANVGYWSKPEKIFEQITDLQIKDPQYAKFTQMQIIVALDQQTNVKATTTPYLDKMTKWANTSGGKSKIAELIGKLNYMTMPDEPTAPGDLGKSSVDKVQYSAKAYLQNFFTQANVPPTSKPEDIWDTIVKAQAFPTYQKMSVATILDVLDDNSPYKTSFKDKISAWVGTKEGKAYIDAVSAQHVNPPSTKTSIPTPPSTSPISSVPKATNTGGDPLPPLKVMGSGEIDHLSPDKKSSVYTAFKNHPSTYVDSPPLSLFDAAKKTAEQHQLDIMQVLRAVDEFGANKFKVQNSKLFEKKVVDWLGTPQGAAVSQGKPVPKPPTPKFSNGINPNVLIPSFEESSGLEYKEVMPYDAVGWFQKAKDKYGEWTTAQKNGLKPWTGGAYMTINHYLWGKSTDASQSTLNTLKHAQAGMRPSLEPILLHRGQNFTGIGNAKNHDDLMKMVGQTWKADGFMATSVGGNAAFGGNVRLDIEAPPGTPMAYVSHISHFKGENEMLLAAGLSYRIISVKQMNGTSVVRVRIVPEPVEQGDAA